MPDPPAPSRVFVIPGMALQTSDDFSCPLTDVHAVVQQRSVREYLVNAGYYLLTYLLTHKSSNIYTEIYINHEDIPVSSRSRIFKLKLDTI
jgi:hypothetical protein